MKNKPEEPKIHKETTRIYKITLWFEKIKNKLMLNKNRKNFINKIIKVQKEFETLQNFNDDVFEKELDNFIIKECFEKQTKIKYSTIFREMNLIDLMTNQKDKDIESTKKIQKLNILKDLKKQLELKPDIHKYIKAIDYSSLHDKFMIKVHLYVDEKTYFEYNLFLYSNLSKYIVD